jgi:2-succinyl-5-enolpyruvyl-6-hydroxy-3-cyclohexene-1-carboxylate synthase
VDAATIQALTQAGFEYQPSSGYWYDAKSGYYYDAKTQLYYHHSTSQWYKYDHATGQYNVVTAEQQQQQQTHGQQVQQQQTQQVQQQQPQQQVQQVQQQQLQQKPAAAADKRRRAVIGSAPQYNREGLLAAAALAKVSALAELCTGLQSFVAAACISFAYVWSCCNEDLANTCSCANACCLVRLGIRCAVLYVVCAHLSVVSS